MSTKRNQGGVQFTERGLVKGVSLVSPKTGLPIDTVVDTLGQTRLLVAADINIASATINVDLDAATDSISIKNSISGNELKINANGSLDVNTTLSHTTSSTKIGDGTDFLAINPDGSINVTGTISSSAGDIFRLIPFEIDEAEITSKNSDGNPLTVLYKKASSTVATLNLTYDSDGDLQSFIRS